MTGKLSNATPCLEWSGTQIFRSCVFRATLFSLLWWILTAGNINSWLVGIPTIVITILVSILLLPPFTWSPVGIARFIPFFIYHSIRGGSDVAWRAIHPRLPIDPVVFDYPLRLESDRCRVFFVSVINLLPGTLSMSLNTSTLKIHALNNSENIIAELRSVEQYVALIFGVELASTGEGEYDEKV